MPKAQDGVPVLSLSEAASGRTVWTYQGSGTPGAVRLISVKRLLDGARSIDLFEWIDLFTPSKSHPGHKQISEPSKQRHVPRYAAISHVWAHSDEALRIAKEANRPLCVETGNPDPHVISWHGLVQCATAAKALKCDYLWLDFLCLDQLSKKDKILQIKNMSRIYSNASIVLVMFGGISAAQGIEHPSSWIDRAWTLQEATLCLKTYGIIDWSNTPDPGASFSQSNTIVTEHSSTFMRHYTRFTSLPGGIAIIPLKALVSFYPGQYLGTGYLGSNDESSAEVEMKIAVNCLGTEQNAIAVLSSAISAMWPEDDLKGQTLSLSESNDQNSVDSGEDANYYNDFAEHLDADYDSDDKKSKEDVEENHDDEDDNDADGWEDTSSGDSSSVSNNNSGAARTRRVDDDDGYNQDLDSEEDRASLRYLSAWRSMWLRTSTKPQDMVFSMMHLLDADIDVQYERMLNDILFELLDKTAANPQWLLIGNRIPVMPNSGLIPILPTFTANSAPTLQIDGIAHPAADLVGSDYGCFNIDIVIKSTSAVDGHNICARMFNVVKIGESRKPGYADDSTYECDLQLTSSGYDVTASCVVDGSLTPVMALIGEYNSRMKDSSWRTHRRGLFPFVYFLGQNSEGVWQKKGVGILHLPLYKKRWSDKLNHIGRRHLQVGGRSPHAELLTCDCSQALGINTDIVAMEITPKSQEELNKQLLDACIYGDEGDIRRILDEGANIDSQDENGSSALQVACIRNDRHIIRVLVDRGADVNIQGGEYGNALQAAAVTRSEEVVSTLIKHGAVINIGGGEYGTALRAACHFGLKNMVKLLVENGADTNSNGGKHGHPLKDAVVGRSITVVQFLIEGGADINMKFNVTGYTGFKESISSCVTALQTSCYAEDARMVRFLLDKGADVNVQGGFWGDALTIAAYYGHMVLLKLLLDSGANINARCKESYYGNALQAACASRYGYIGQAALVLIESGANVNAQGGYFGTPLQAASLWYQDNVVRKLIEKGANVNARGGKYGTALQAVATTKYHGDIARILIEHGADVNVDKKYRKDLQETLEHTYEGVVRRRLEKGANINNTHPRFGNTLQMACLGNYVETVVLLDGKKHLGKFRPESVSTWEHEEVVRLLVNKGADVNLRGGEYSDALQAASVHGNINVVKLLIDDFGAEVNACGGYYGTALQAASRHGFSEVVTYLITKGADVNAIGGQYDNSLLAAVYFGHLETVKLLLQNGADINKIDIQGRNLLHIAASRGNRDIVDYLMELDIDLKALDHQGRSALHHAASSGSTAVVDLFVKKSSEPNIVDRDGWTPLHWAARKGEKHVVELLLEAGSDAARADSQGWIPVRVAIFHRNLSLKSILTSSIGPKRQSSLLKPVSFGGNKDIIEPEVGYLHKNVECDGCRLSIYGPRYNCNNCPNFDYCFKCKLSAHLTHHPNHNFEKIDH